MLRRHSDEAGHDYDTIEKTSVTQRRLGPDEDEAKALEELRTMHDLGVTVAVCSLRGRDAVDRVIAYKRVITEISA